LENQSHCCLQVDKIVELIQPPANKWLLSCTFADDEMKDHSKSECNHKAEDGAHICECSFVVIVHSTQQFGICAFVFVNFKNAHDEFIEWNQIESRNAREK
jgi:hypothetical protein